MKRKIFISVLLTVFAISGYGWQKDFDINNVFPIEPAHSYLGFNVKYMGYAMVRGRFTSFKGTLYYDENDITKTSVSLAIDVSSVDTDVDFRDRDLKSPNWFDAETFPKIVFESTSVKGTEDGMDVTGNLTIKDVTKEVTVHMEKPSGKLKDIRDDVQVIFTGSLKVDRTDYHVEGKNWSKVKEGIVGVANEANIEISILAKQIKKNNFSNWLRNPNRPPGKIFNIVENEGLEKGLEEFDNMVKSDSIRIGPAALTLVGYMLLLQDKVDDAITVFEKNLSVFPDNPNIYDSLGEAWAHKDLKQSRKYYAIALQKDPDNINAKEILRHLGN